MTLYKIEDVIAEARPGLTRADILSMPFYEFMLKLDIMKERAEEREKKENAENNNTAMERQKQSMSKMMQPPKMPKLPSGMKF